MSEQDCGRVVPFTFSPSRLKRSAAERRRRGRPVDAAELLRQAAERSDDTLAWIDLAGEMAELGCYEQAAVILYRMLARPDVTLDAWMLLARCQRALGRRDSAIDCLYHYLSQDPFSEASDTARAMLADLEDGRAEHDAYRLPRLIRRGLNAWRAGDRATGEKRLKRAVKLSSAPARLHVTLALLMMAENDTKGAIRQLTGALAHEKDNARARTAMCVGLAGMGFANAARRMLRGCEKLCASPENEELFLTAAWMLDDGKARRRFLEEGLRRMPCRIALMHPLALCRMEDGQTAAAAQLWQRILRIDPGDQRARISLKWIQEHSGEGLPQNGMLPPSEVRARLMMLVRQAESGVPCHALIAQGSQTRMIADWCLQMADEGLQTALLSAVGREEHPAVKQFLREVLTCPTAVQSVREKALAMLEDMGEGDTYPMLLGAQMTQARSTARLPKKSRWATFLQLLLEESRERGQGMQLAFYAADEWRQMSRRQRRQAAESDSYCFAKTIEILYLRETGQDEAAMRVLRETDASPRRVERVMRGLAPHHELLKGEE